MDFGLSGKTAVVTGGAGRIGSEDCQVLAAEGAEVIVLDLDLEAAQEVADDIVSEGGSARAVSCNLTSREDVEATVEQLREKTGGVDVLVNNAAMVNARSLVRDYNDEMWDRDIEVNLTGTYNITREIFPAMCERGWGRVINMSSMAGWYGGFGQASYAATKSALIGLGKTLALEGAQKGVTSNIIAPNVVLDDYADMSIEELEEERPYFAKIARSTPMRSLGREEDVANLIAYLSSTQANYITGQVVGVTGGIDLFAV